MGAPQEFLCVFFDVVLWMWFKLLVNESHRTERTQSPSGFSSKVQSTIMNGSHRLGWSERVWGQSTAWASTVWHLLDLRNDCIQCRSAEKLWSHDIIHTTRSFFGNKHMFHHKEMNHVSISLQIYSTSEQKVKFLYFPSTYRAKSIYFNSVQNHTISFFIAVHITLFAFAS